MSSGKKGLSPVSESDNHQRRKELGIFYTPDYIVDYIVKNTLGELLKDKKVNPDNIRILDPACGSGFFLIKAFDVLSEHFSRNDRHYSQTKMDFKTGDGFTTKVRILQNNIFGVDLDKQAVEIAQLNLLLKIAEKGRRLPLLHNNIKCGNSLIDNPLIAGDKALKWEEEFKDVMREGGFDVVMGNPPWGADIDDVLDYLKEKFPYSTKEHKDIYKCFLEQGMNLLRENGVLGFIVPNTCLFQPRYRDIRLFLKQYTLLKIMNLGEKVFEGVEAPACIIVIKKMKGGSKHKVKVLDVSNLKGNEYKARSLASPTYSSLLQGTYNKTVDNNFVTFYRELKSDEKYMDDIMDLRDCGIKYQRTGVGMKEKGKNDLFDRLFYEGERKNKNDKPYIIGADLRRYFIDTSNSRFMRNDFKSLLKPNEIVYFNEAYFNAPEKILWRQTADKPICSISGRGWFANTLQAGVLKEEFKKTLSLKYVLALLNSKYLSYLYIQSARELGRVFPQVKLNKIKQLPIKIISFQEQQRFAGLADKMLALNKRLGGIGDKKTSEKEKMASEIERADDEIDELVYNLYGITKDEKQIIELSMKEKAEGK